MNIRNRWRERAMLAICIIVHGIVLWNLYEADQLTPRIINATITRCV